MSIHSIDRSISTRIGLFGLLPPDTVGAEIGVFRGDFTEHIMRTPVAKVYLVDSWQKMEDYQDGINDSNFDDNLNETRRKIQPFGDRCVIVQGLSAEIAASNQSIPPLDWVYIDCNHEYSHVLSDLTDWSKRLKPGGVIMGHDYNESGSIARALNFGVIRAVGVFCHVNGWRITHLDQEEYASYRLEKVT